MNVYRVMIMNVAVLTDTTDIPVSQEETGEPQNLGSRIGPEGK